MQECPEKTYPVQCRFATPFLYTKKCDNAGGVEMANLNWFNFCAKNMSTSLEMAWSRQPSVNDFCTGAPVTDKTFATECWSGKFLVLEFDYVPRPRPTNKLTGKKNGGWLTRTGRTFKNQFFRRWVSTHNKIMVLQNDTCIAKINLCMAKMKLWRPSPFPSEVLPLHLKNG